MILVAGGTGHLGIELVPLLTARGIPVRVVTRDPDRARQRLGETPQLAKGDARNPQTLEEALKGVDAVVSAMTGFGPGAPGPKAVDYEGNLNLIRAAEAAGVRRFVLVSIHGATADHAMELWRMKYRAEEALRASRLDWVIVRLQLGQRCCKFRRVGALRSRSQPHNSFPRRPGEPDLKPAGWSGRARGWPEGCCETCSLADDAADVVGDAASQA